MDREAWNSVHAVHMQRAVFRERISRKILKRLLILLYSPHLFKSEQVDILQMLTFLTCYGN